MYYTTLILLHAGMYHALQVVASRFCDEISLNSKYIRQTTHMARLSLGGVGTAW